MTVTQEMVAAGLKASYSLRDNGDSSRNLKPCTFTACPSDHARVILEAGLALQTTRAQRD